MEKNFVDDWGLTKTFGISNLVHELSSCVQWTDSTSSLIWATLVPTAHRPHIFMQEKIAVSQVSIGAKKKLVSSHKRNKLNQDLTKNMPYVLASFEHNVGL